MVLSTLLVTLFYYDNNSEKYAHYTHYTFEDTRLEAV